MSATPLWINDGGRAVCEACAAAGKGGSELRAAVEAEPDAAMLVTPLGSWVLVSPELLAGITCETHR